MTDLETKVKYLFEVMGTKVVLQSAKQIEEAFKKIQRVSFNDRNFNVDSIQKAIAQTTQRVSGLNKEVTKNTVDFNQLIDTTISKLDDQVRAQTKASRESIRAIKEQEAAVKKAEAEKVKAQKQAEKELAIQGRSLARQNKFAANSIREIDVVLKDLNKQIDDSEPRFQGWALSVMFAGQALQRASLSIARFGIKSFDEISHSVEGTVTQTDRLQGSMKFLGFVIGDALQPVIEFIIPIVEAVANWVEENQGLAATLTAGGVLLGGLLTFIGFMTLAESGVTMLLTKIKDLSGISLNTGDLVRGAVTIPFAFMAAKDAYDAFSSGDTLKGVYDALKSAGFLAIAGGKTGVGAALVGVGIALQLVDIVKDGATLSKSALAEMFFQAGAGAVFLNPGVGAALFSVGFALQFVSDGTFAKIYTKLAQMFGLLVIGVAAVLDTALMPIKTIITALIKLWNMVSRKDKQINIKEFGLDTFFSTTMTDAAIARMNELVQQYKDLEAADQVAMEQKAKPTPTLPVTQSSQFAGSGTVINFNNGITMNLTKQQTDQMALLLDLMAKNGANGFSVLR